MEILPAPEKCLYTRQKRNHVIYEFIPDAMAVLVIYEFLYTDELFLVKSERKQEWIKVNKWEKIHRRYIEPYIGAWARFREYGYGKRVQAFYKSGMYMWLDGPVELKVMKCGLAYWQRLYVAVSYDPTTKLTPWRVSHYEYLNIIAKSNGRQPSKRDWKLVKNGRRKNLNVSGFYAGGGMSL